MCGANDAAPPNCQPTQGCNQALTQVRDLPRQRGNSMASDPLANVRSQVALRVAEIRDAGPRLSPLDPHTRMDAFRQLAVSHGLGALECLARRSAQLAL